VSARTTSRPWWALAAMCFALFMIMLDNTIVNVALPSIQRSVHTTPQTLQSTIDAYLLTFAVLAILIAASLELSDDDIDTIERRD